MVREKAHRNTPNKKVREAIPGVTYISSQTRELVLQLKLQHTFQRTGKITTEAQRKIILNHITENIAVAKQQGLKADAAFLESQLAKTALKKLSNIH